MTAHSACSLPILSGLVGAKLYTWRPCFKLDSTEHIKNMASNALKLETVARVGAQGIQCIIVVSLLVRWPGAPA